MRENETYHQFSGRSLSKADARNEWIDTVGLPYRPLDPRDVASTDIAPAKTPGRLISHIHPEYLRRATVGTDAIKSSNAVRTKLT